MRRSLDTFTYIHNDYPVGKVIEVVIGLLLNSVLGLLSYKSPWHNEVNRFFAVSGVYFIYLGISAFLIRRVKLQIARNYYKVMTEIQREKAAKLEEENRNKQLMRPVSYESKWEGEVCAICLTDLFDQESKTDVSVLIKCSHSFHTKCIVQWLRRSKSCPTDRRALW